MAFSMTKDPKSWFLTVDHQSVFGGPNRIALNPGQVAIFAQIFNQGQDTIQVRLNDDPASVFTLEAGNIQVFNEGDVHITVFDFQDMAVSGGGTHDNPVQIIAGVVLA